MTKKTFVFACLATLFAACANEDDSQLGDAQPGQADATQVSFDAYTMRNTTTRAGYAGTVGIDQLKSQGFGVFAYYTDNLDYSPHYTANFMYNEKVSWDDGTSAFKYDVTKYWPNEFGSAAKSIDRDRISFFAYAPYVDSDPTTGMIKVGGSIVDASAEEAQWGITSMKRNSLEGDPLIQYVTSFDQAKSVDLCWGTTGSADVTWNTNSDAQTVVGGYPWLNIRRPDGVSGDASRIKFSFQHATSQLTVTVKSDFTGNWTTTNAEQTKVWVRSIRFTGLAHKGALNLNNPKTLAKNKARWMDYYGTMEMEKGESVTIHDGRKDGSENVEGAEAGNETIVALNPQLVQDEHQLVNGEWNGTHSGVTTTAQHLFCNGSAAATQPIYVIPTGEKVTVEIVYDIETIDSKLPRFLSDGATHGLTVENRISKTLTAIPKFENGKAYTINLILGLKDVQFNAAVTPWIEVAAVEDVNLPNNVPEFASVLTSSDTKYDINVSAPTTAYIFAVTGFTPGEAVTGNVAPTDNVSTIALNSTPDFTSTDGKANSSGIVYAKATITAITDVLKKTNADAITITGSPSTSTRKAVFNVIQAAHDLGLTVASVADNGEKSEINLTCSTLAEAGHWQVQSTGGSSDQYVKVYKNGVKMDSHTTPTAGKYNFATTDASNAKITLGTPVKAGEIYTITIKTGDAPEETVVAKIGGIAFSPSAYTWEYRANAGSYSANPTYIGEEPTGYAYSVTSGNDYAEIYNSGPKITTKQSSGENTATIKCEATRADGNNWFYTTNTKTATYTVKVTKQPAHLTRDDLEVKLANISGYNVDTNKPTVIANEDGTPENATYTYEISEQSAVSGAVYSMTPAGVISNTGTADVGDKIKVKATATYSNEKYSLTENTIIYTVTVIAD